MVERDDIIRMAREAELYEDGAFFVCTHSEIERFAQLVAAHEREECAKIADKWAVGWPHPSTVIAEEIRSRGNT